MRLLSMVNHLLDVSELEVGVADLDQPVSLTAEDNIATLNELIGAFGSPKLLEIFHLGAIDESEVRSVMSLTYRELQRIAASMLEREPNDMRRGSSGEPGLSPQELREEVLQGSLTGREFVESFRMHALLLETAVLRGRIKLVDVPDEIGEIPLDR